LLHNQDKTERLQERKAAYAAFYFALSWHEPGHFKSIKGSPGHGLFYLVK